MFGRPSVTMIKARCEPAATAPGYYALAVFIPAAMSVPLHNGVVFLGGGGGKEFTHCGKLLILVCKEASLVLTTSGAWYSKGVSPNNVIPSLDRKSTRLN